MATFITDRTPYHVNLLKELRKTPWGDMTEAQKELWETEAAKGAINYTDFNRLGAICNELAQRYGVQVSVRTNWTISEGPTTYECATLMTAIETLCNHVGLQTVSFSTNMKYMRSFSVYDMNYVEQLLQKAYNSYSVTYDLTNCAFPEESYYHPNYAAADCSFYCQVANDGDYRPNYITVWMGGVDVTSTCRIYYTENYTSIQVPKVTGNLVIEAEGTYNEYSVQITAPHTTWTADILGETTTLTPNETHYVVSVGKTVRITFTEEMGYEITVIKAIRATTTSYHYTNTVTTEDAVNLEVSFEGISDVSTNSSSVLGTGVIGQIVLGTA